jgi:PAS domain S-box-containing protein
MKFEKLFFQNRILLSTLLPVLGIGLIIASLSIYYFTPPLTTFLKERTDSELKLASNLGLGICENHLNYLLDLRLEDDPEMNAALREEAIQEIKNISNQLHKIHMLVIENEGVILGSSMPFPQDHLTLPRFIRGKTPIINENMWDRPFRIHMRYFPFWNWHILSFTTQKDYMAPIIMAKKIVYAVTFGLLGIMVLATTIIFYFFVNKPLKKIIRATERIAQGEFNKAEIDRKDEIGQVAASFNAMVDSLEENQHRINGILSELKESEEMYRVITEHSLAQITIVHDGRMIYANSRAIQASGYSPEEYIGMDPRRLIHPDDLAMIQEKTVNKQADWSSVDHYEFRYISKDGRTRWLEMLAVPVLYKGKRVSLGHAIDITQRKESAKEQARLERKLQQAHRMEAIGTLAAGVAHDLNNILSGLVSYPELLVMDLEEDNPWRNPLLTIQASGQKAAAIVQDLLTLARRGVSVTEVVYFNDVIEAYLNSPEYQKLKSFHPNVVVQTDLAQDLLNILGSPIHLSKTVMNLISNAAEAMPEAGTILVSTKNRYIDRPVRGYDDVKEGDYIILSVSDMGIGIAPEDMEKIFEPFYTKKVMGRSGTGLGMAVVWSTVKDHEGYINVESDEGVGTTFSLFFPITRKKLEKEESQIPLDNYKGKGESILVVDDVSEQREIAKRMLQKLDYAVTAFSSGEEAIDYMKDHSADLLLLDMIMDPGIDGLETYKRILELHPSQKAIITSGFSETERVKEAQRLGAGAYIRKPYLIKKIGISIRAELERAV